MMTHFGVQADEIGVDAETYCKEVDILRKVRFFTSVD